MAPEKNEELPNFQHMQVWIDQTCLMSMAGLMENVHILLSFLFFSHQEELETAKQFLYYEMGYKARSEQLTDRSEINLSPLDIDR